MCKNNLYRYKRKFKWNNEYVNKNINRSEYRTLTPQKKNLARKLRRKGLFWQDIADKIEVNLATLYRHGLPKQKIRQLK